MEEKEIYLLCFSECAVEQLSCKNIVETCRFRLSISLDSLGDKKKSPPGVIFIDVLS